jgi:hypothetical protein
VTNGAMALARAVRGVVDHPIIQHCQLSSVPSGNA